MDNFHSNLTDITAKNGALVERTRGRVTRRIVGYISDETTFLELVQMLIGGESILTRCTVIFFSFLFSIL